MQIELNQAETDLILEALSELPLKRSGATFNKVLRVWQEQAKEQPTQVVEAEEKQGASDEL